MADKLAEEPFLPTEINSLVLELNRFFSLVAFRVNRTLAEVLLTADLPAAGAIEDGTMLMEDAGVNDVNLILYAKGQRYRIDGGAPF